MRSSNRKPAEMGRRARRISALSLIAAGVMLVVAPTVAAAENDNKPVVDESAITITQTPSADQPACLPPLLALSTTVGSTDEEFVLTVTASAPPCDPIEATAVVYAMPGDGVAWPQTLIEKKSFTIDAAGVTVIRFAKDCSPVQFDVVTGATPDVISPTGEWHGPLLFPTDVGTSQQYEGCVENSTSTAPTTSVSETTVPATTVPPTTAPTPTTQPEVLSQTTLRPAASTPAPVVAPAAQVLASSDTNGVKADSLARTGAESNISLLVGLGLVAAGASMLLLARRRTAEA